MVTHLNDQDLIAEVKRLIGEEKKILQSVLDHLGEIDNRRLYSLRGYPSLFEFCVKELGYSEGSAQRRISAMRLMRILPEAKVKFEAGTVNLSTLSQLHSFIRKEETVKNKKLHRHERLRLLNSIENKSQKECEREFVKLNPDFVKRETLRPLTSNSYELKITISNDLQSKFEQLKNLLSHQNKSHTVEELLEIMADVTLREIEKKKTAKITDTEAKISKAIGSDSPTAAAAVTPNHLSLQAVKRLVYTRDQGECQYIDPATKRKCQSRFKIQFEHIYPKALGGEDSCENLQLLCQSHNLLRATQAYSKKYMDRYLRR